LRQHVRARDLQSHCTTFAGRRSPTVPVARRRRRRLVCLTDSNPKLVPDHRVGCSTCASGRADAQARVMFTLPRRCSCRSRCRLRCDKFDRLTALRILHRASRWIDRERKKLSRKCPNQVHNATLRVWHSA